MCVSIGRKDVRLLPKWILSITILEVIIIARLSCDSTKRCETVQKASKYRVFSGPYFPRFRLNSQRYGVSVPKRENTDQKRLRVWTLFTQYELQLPGK